jgi:hypothetical protein
VKFAIIYCKDLYDKAAERLKGLDNDIDKTIQDLAKDIEARGVPKNKVARQVVKELTARGVLSPSRIYKVLETEQKRKYEKRQTEETFPRMKNISTEESSTNQQAIQVVATRTGRSGILKDMNRGLDMKLVSEEQEQIAELWQENERLKEKERKKEKSHDEPRLLNAKELEKISVEAGRDIETILQHRNTVVRNEVESGRPLHLGAYIIIKPRMALMPVRITIDFEKRNVEYSLWKEKLQVPTPSTSVSSDTSKVHF